MNEGLCRSKDNPKKPQEPLGTGRLPCLSRAKSGEQVKRVDGHIATFKTRAAGSITEHGLPPNTGSACLVVFQALQGYPIPTLTCIVFDSIPGGIVAMLRIDPGNFDRLDDAGSGFKVGFCDHWLQKY